MRRRGGRLVAVLVLAGAGACARPDATEAQGDVCRETTREALELVASVANENVACTTDAECTTFAASGSCFDACTRTVNETGKGALDRSLLSVEAGPCRTFSNAGCTKVTPPCAPPTAPVCREGRCQ